MPRIPFLNRQTPVANVTEPRSALQSETPRLLNFELGPDLFHVVGTFAEPGFVATQIWL